MRNKVIGEDGIELTEIYFFGDREEPEYTGVKDNYNYRGKLVICGGKVFGKLEVTSRNGN